MEYGSVQREIQAEVESLLAGMGFELVELRLVRGRMQTRIQVTVYRSLGVGINDCSSISRNLRPRLELIEGLGDFMLEISSPGVDRLIKAPQEYRVFQGRGVRLLLENEEDWLGGVISGVTAEAVLLARGGRVEEIRLASIRKARLDHTQEVLK